MSVTGWVGSVDWLGMTVASAGGSQPIRVIIMVVVRFGIRDRVGVRFKV